MFDYFIIQEYNDIKGWLDIRTFYDYEYETAVRFVKAFRVKYHSSMFRLVGVFSE